MVSWLTWMFCFRQRSPNVLKDALGLFLMISAMRSSLICFSVLMYWSRLFSLINRFSRSFFIFTPYFLSSFKLSPSDRLISMMLPMDSSLSNLLTVPTQAGLFMPSGHFNILKLRGIGGDVKLPLLFQMLSIIERM